MIATLLALAPFAAASALVAVVYLSRGRGATRARSRS